MATLRLLAHDAVPEDGVHQFDQRCTCPDRANIRCRVVGGKVVEAGCPVCGREAVIEISPDGSLGCFPVGIRIF